MTECFGGTYHFQLQCRISGEQEISVLAGGLAELFVRLVFDPEDRGDTFLRNVGSYTGYKALELTRGQLPNQPL
jgi:hypothetical protein